MNTTVQSQDRGPVGVGGWLMLLVVIMAVLGPLAGLGVTGLEMSDLERQYLYLVTYDWWSSYKSAMWVGMLGFVAAGLWGAYSLCTLRTPVGVFRAKIALWLIYPGTVVVSRMMVPVMYLPNGGEVAAQSIAPLLAALFWLAVWISYLNKSKRVKNTYFSDDSTPVAAPRAFAVPNQPVGGNAVTASSSPHKTSSLTSSVDEDAVYAIVANEMESGKADKGLWTRLFAEFEGDEKRIKVAYIKQRAAKLLLAERARLAEIEHVAEANNREFATETDRLEAMRRAIPDLKTRVSERIAKGDFMLQSSDYFLEQVALGNVEKIEEMLDTEEMYVAATSKDTGNTPLHIAVAEQNAEMLRVLLRRGALALAKNSVGLTPLDFAKRYPAIQQVFYAEGVVAP